MSDIKTELINNGTVAIVSFNRAKKFNSLTWDSFAQLQKEMERLGKHGGDVRCIVLRGEGKHFTAGLDLMSAASMQDAKTSG